MAYINIISATPKDGAADVLLESTIQIVTSVTLQPSSVNNTSFVVSDTGANIVDGTLAYSVQQRANQAGLYGVITFTPQNTLRALETYTVSLTSLLGTGDETLEVPITIVFTAGEIFSRTLTTYDNISFFEKICYPQDGSNIDSNTSYNSGVVVSQYSERQVPGQEFPIAARVASGAGTIVPEGNVWVEAGKSKTFSISPATNYTLDALYIDGVIRGGAQVEFYPSEWTFSNILSSHSISAVFKHVPLSIVVGITGPGNVIPDTTQVEYGAAQTFTLEFDEYANDTVNLIIPRPGLSRTTTPGDTTFAIPNIEEDMNITVEFSYRDLKISGYSTTASLGTVDVRTWTEQVDGVPTTQYTTSPWEYPTGVTYGDGGGDGTIVANFVPLPGYALTTLKYGKPGTDRSTFNDILTSELPAAFAGRQLTWGTHYEDRELVYEFGPGFSPKFDTTWWQTPITGTRGASDITSDGTGLIVHKPNQAVHGAWNSGYRPRYIRLTFNGVASLSSLTIKDGNGVATYLTLNNLFSGQIYSLAGQSGNIGRLYLQASAVTNFFLTNIEFMD